MKWQANFFVILLFIVTMIASAQTSTEARGQAQETQVRGYWIDPSTGLMWAGKDNGKDVNWHKAAKYCRDLQLAGYSDWRLATIDELRKIYDRNADAPGRAGKHSDQPFTFHVKGNLFLTGAQWTSSRVIDDRGLPSGYAWYFNFNDGSRVDDPLGYYTFKRALCVRQSAQ